VPPGCGSRWKTATGPGCGLAKPGTL